MKIAQIAPLIERVPPKMYGGTERVISALTEELARRGHEVTLFATGDSKTSAKLEAVYPKSLREARIKPRNGVSVWTLANVGQAYAKQEQFDIIHDHTGFIGLPTAHVSKTPTVMTMHGAFTIESRQIFRLLSNPYVVTISKSQAESTLHMRHAGTIYNGLPMAHYPFSPDHDDYLLYVGRICMEKGVHLAIETAQALHLPLIIAAKLDYADVSYFKEYIEPHLSEQIQWIGEVGEEKRNALMSRALCFLHPVGPWKEPFGLTLIEAMACGTPVVAFNKGSIPEIIVHGQTGFIVSNVEEMIDAVSLIHTLDRNTCREHALAHFNDKKMADGYETLYKDILLKKL